MQDNAEIMILSSQMKYEIKEIKWLTPTRACDKTVQLPLP